MKSRTKKNNSVEGENMAEQKNYDFNKSCTIDDKQKKMGFAFGIQRPFEAIIMTHSPFYSFCLQSKSKIFFSKKYLGLPLN